MIRVQESGIVTQSDAIGRNDTVITSPYIFFTSKEIGLTVARSLKSGAGVVGADTVLTSISTLLQKKKLTASTELILSNKDGNIRMALT